VQHNIDTHVRNQLILFLMLLVSFVICKAEAREICFSLLDEKEHTPSKESRMMKGDEGRRAKALDQRRRRKEVFVMGFFCSEITQNVSFFCLGARRKESGDMW